MATLQWLTIVLAACMGLALAEENCDEEKWLPQGEGTSHEGCVEYDGSLVPDCGEFLQNDKTSYYHVHEYNCSRFWECSPQGACLTSCAPCNVEMCGNYDGLVFDCRYQYPVGPVCDFPDNVNCTNGYSTSNRVPTTTTTTTTTTTHPEGYCESDADCTGSSCSHCVNNQCVDPECCTSDDCADVTDMVCSVCDMETCSMPECCADEDCPAVTDRICSVCGGDTCSRPECCVDSDCLDGYICEDQKCVEEGECDVDRPCENSNAICDIDNNYNNCDYCDLDAKECKPGCETNANCPGEKPTCSNHRCMQVGNTGLTNITIMTKTCSQCPGSGNPLGVVEQGLKVTLLGEYGTSCESSGLDNLEKVDYDNGKTSFFDGAPEDDGDDDGLGGCKNADLNYGLTGGTATWTGKGTWTGADSNTICIDFYDPDNNKPTCCCSLAKSSLEQDETTELSGCECML